MVHKIKIFFFAFLAFTSFQVTADSNDSFANEVVKRSGLSTMISQFPALLKEGIRQGAEQSGGNNQKRVVQIGEIIDRAFIVQESLDAVQKDLGSQLSQAELEAVLEWLNSPLGKKVTQLEIAAMSLASYQEMQSQLLDLQKKYRGSDRERLFQAFDKATNATDASLETAIAVQLTLASAMAASSNNPQMPTYEQLKQSVEDNRFMMRGVIGQQVFANYLYTYQHLTDEELKAYIDFTASPAGHHFSMVINESVKNVLLKPSEVIGSQIMGNVISG